MRQHNQLRIHNNLGVVVKVDHTHFYSAVVYNSCC